MLAVALFIINKPLPVKFFFSACDLKINSPNFNFICLQMIVDINFDIVFSLLSKPIVERF